MGLGSSIRRIGRRLDKNVSDNGARFEDEYKRWWRDADPYVKWLGYGMYAGQANLATREGAKKSGYSKEESESLGDRLGTNYQSVNMDKTLREVAEKDQVAQAALQRQRVAEETRARGQIAARIRRGARPNGMGRDPGALAGGGLGTAGAASSFAALLGL